MPADFSKVQELMQLRSQQAGGLAQAGATNQYQAPTPGTVPMQGGGYSQGAGFIGGNSAGLTTFMGKPVNAAVAPMFNQLHNLFPALRFSSGYRDPNHNKAVGGVANSNHLTGRAGDWSGSSRDMYAAAGWARANGAREVLVHNAGSGLHLHVAW